MAQSPGGDTSDLALHTTTASGSKRLFSKRASKDFPEYGGGQVVDHPEDVDDPDSHLEKRSRNSEWPLKSNGPRPEHQHKRSSSQSRPSRFVEGSMNDRASKKPLLSYAGDFEASVQQRDGKQNKSKIDGKKQRSQGKAQAAKNALLPAFGDESDVTRPSGFFRFGRSIAAAFNPASWKIWPKQQEGAVRERIHGTGSEKVEDHRASNGIRNMRRSATRSQTDMRGKRTSFSKHDSGIEFVNPVVLEDPGKHAPSRKAESSEEKRYGRVFEEDLIIGQWDHDQGRALGEISNLADIPRQNRKSSLPNIHMVYKHRKTPDHSDNPMRQPSDLRRLPSRKDLQKQQKLVKRVSDLEGRLEAARRQLAEALGEPIPEKSPGLFRSRFTPGALASLPSERLLAAYAAEESAYDAVDATSGIGKAASADQRAESLVSEEEAEAEVEDPKLKNSLPQTKVVAETIQTKRETSTESNTQPWITPSVEATKQTQSITSPLTSTSPRLERSRRSFGKRKSDTFGPFDDSDAYRPPADSDGDDGTSQEATKKPTLRRKAIRPRKVQKIEVDADVNSTSSPQGLKFKGKRNASSAVRGRGRGRGRGRSRGASRGGHSPSYKESKIGVDSGDEVEVEVEADDEVPPVPKLPPDVLTGISSIAGRAGIARPALAGNAAAGDVPAIVDLGARAGSEVAAIIFALKDEEDGHLPIEKETSVKEPGDEKRDIRDGRKDEGVAAKGKEEPFEWPEDVF